MKRNELNEKLRDYARQLSPTADERTLISKVSGSINDLFGAKNCIQIGSYPRFTATTPIHDLDILYVLGRWDAQNHNPETTLRQLHNLLVQHYKTPTAYMVKLSLQDHSVTIEFYSGKNLILSVDIVPAYSYLTNEFGEPTYMLPEVIKQKNHQKRHQTQWDPYQEDGWIHSDPRGYLSIASEVGQNSDFRKSVKIAKDWKNRLKDADENLKLKSFHLEQVITRMFKEDELLDLADAVFNFFVDIPDIIGSTNQIADRANPNKYIDDYLADFTEAQKARVIHARDNVLIALEQITPDTDIADALEPNFKQRNPDEQFMFDHSVPVHLDYSNRRLAIDFDEMSPNRAERRRAQRRQQPIGNKLFFKILEGFDDAMTYFWKVKNSDLLSVDKRRGDITKNQTKNHPESTLWPGDHYVECYAVNEEGVCTDIARVDVPIGEEYAQ
jgi:hypothetical protein